MGAGVFVSYRKDDDPGWAGRVRDSLAHHFGDDNVFFDVNSIRGGQRWEDAIDSALIQSQSVILIVGPRWLRCLQDRAARPEIDYHLRELTMALDRGIPVYPVRVHSAVMPDLADLPEELRARLPAIQWMEVYEDLFTASMQRIIADIEHSTGLFSPTAYLPRHVSVVLINEGDKKIQVIKEVRGLTGISLAEAKDLVEAAPRHVLERVPMDEAERAREALEAAGATVELK